MASYNVHAGHCPQGKGASGAVGILKESVEDRLVKDEVIRLLRAEGHTVYDCTVNYATTKQGCLDGIVALCNQHAVNLDISIHLNSGRNDYIGDKSTGGTEVFNYDSRTKGISDRICKNISDTLSIRNRGTKYDKSLQVLNRTKSLAILIECCFVDDKDDTDRWNYKKCAKAIAEGILGRSISSGSSSSGGTASGGQSSGQSSSTGNGQAVWQAYAAGKWWSYVKENGTGTEAYAGVLGQPLRALRAYVKGAAKDVGYLEYRMHRINSGWYNWQRDREMDKNGENYAGDCKNQFDGLQMRITGAPGKHVKYRVHVIGKGWLGWVTDWGSGNNGYAGLWGYAIDAVQIKIV